MFKITPTSTCSNAVTTQKLQGTQITKDLTPIEEEALIWDEAQGIWVAGFNPEEGTVESVQNATNSGELLVNPPYTSNPTVKTILPSGIIQLFPSSTSLTIGANHAAAEFNANYGQLVGNAAIVSFEKFYNSRYFYTATQTQVFGRVDINFTFVGSPVNVQALSFQFDILPSITPTTELICLLSSGAFQNRNIDAVFTNLTYVSPSRVLLQCSVIDETLATNVFNLSFNYCVSYARV